MASAKLPTDARQNGRARRSNSVTVKEVARLAEVAVPTAYEALRGDGRLRAETRERVRKAAAELGYRPNRTALNMRRGRHGAFGLLLKEWTIFPKSYLFALLDAARRRDHFLLIEYSDGSTTPRLLREDCIDGLIVFEPLEDQALNSLKQSGVPVIEANTNRQQEPGCITYDEVGAVRQITRHLADIGRKRPALLMPFLRPNETPHYSRQVRLDALSGACEEAGLAQPVVTELKPSNWDLKAHHQAVDFLIREKNVDSLILYSDAMAAGVYHAAVALNLQIPKDFAVVGFNNSFKAMEVIPHLTSVGIPPEAFADAALDMIGKALETDQPMGPLTMQYEFYPRGSTIPGEA